MELADLVARHRLPAEAEERLAALLAGLAREPDPQTTVPPHDWLDVHVADSLLALDLPPVRAARRLADVGAGAGFPGLPVAIALPDARVDLIESSARKIALIGRLIDAAAIANAHPVGVRAEDWARGEGSMAYDVVCARALGPLPLVLEYAAPLLVDGGTLVAWRGRRSAEEDAAASKAGAELGLELLEVRAVTPYEGSRDRHLHLYRKSSPTPERFPRRAGMAAKRPLA